MRAWRLGRLLELDSFIWRVACVFLVVGAAGTADRGWALLALLTYAGITLLGSPRRSQAWRYWIRSLSGPALFLALHLSGVPLLVAGMAAILATADGDPVFWTTLPVAAAGVARLLMEPATAERPLLLACAVVLVGGVFLLGSVRKTRAVAPAPARNIALTPAGPAVPEEERDQLTGLLTPGALRAQLERTMEASEPFALLVIDLDHFAEVTNALGRDGGDRVLTTVAERLFQQLPEGTPMARDGDEFLTVVKPATHKREVAAFVEQVRRVLAHPLPAEPPVMMTASVGVAIYPGDAVTASDLMGRADVALHQAKEAGRNCYRFYYGALDHHLVRRLHIHSALHEVLEKGELSVHYQPQVNMATGEVLGVEGLARWCHPLYGPIPPAEFVPLAELDGSMAGIGDWVLETACREIGRLERDEPLRLSVNLSATQLASPDAADRLEGIILKTGFDPTALTLEVTESQELTAIPRLVEKLLALRRLGIELAVDDFGTGFASLAYLQRLPVDVVKIDRSFIEDIQDRPAIPSGILTLARHMGLSVVAEGVETGYQASYLQALGCYVVQGFYYARPMPFEVLAEWLKTPLVMDADSVS